MAILTITNGAADDLAVTKVSPIIEDCITIYEYIISTNNGDTISIDLAGNHYDAKYITNTSEVSFSDNTSVVFSGYLKLRFLLLNSDQIGVKSNSTVTITNITNAKFYSNFVERDNDSANCYEPTDIITRTSDLINDGSDNTSTYVELDELVSSIDSELGNTDWQSGGSSSGDMTKAVYDTNDNGIVDNSALVNGLSVETAVPSGAIFTDTTYTDAEIKTKLENNPDTNTVTDSQLTDLGTISSKLDSIVAGTNIVIDNTDPNNPILSSSSGGGNIGGSINDNQIAVGNALNTIEGTIELLWDGIQLGILGSSSDRYIRFSETSGQFNGAYLQYEGSTNKFHMGVHSTADANPANDSKSLTMQRSDGFIGIKTETPGYELDVNGTLNSTGARIAPTFADFQGRFSTGGTPSFGGSRLGDSDLQTASLDIGSSINFIDDTVAQQVNFSMFENNDVFTLRSSGGNKVGVFDLNGGNQAIWNTDDAESTFANTINYTDGKTFVNDMGVQYYTSNGSIVAQKFFHVIQNLSGAPELDFLFTRYDGTTYDPIFTVDANEVVDFENTPTVNGNEIAVVEQGSFTPTLDSFYTIGGAAEANYVKIGRSMFIRIRITGISTGGSPAGALQVYGLPSTLPNSVSLLNYQFINNGANVDNLSAETRPSEDSVWFYNRASISVINDLPSEYISPTITDGSIYITGTYYTF